VAVTLAPPPDAVGAGAEFIFRGVTFTSARGGGAPVALTLTRATTAATLLAWCAAWLALPAESLSVAGGRLVLSASTPERTAEEAGLGADADAPGAPPPTRRVFALPWCAICLSAASGVVWTCRGGGDDADGGGATARHRFCAQCVRRYAATALSARSAAALRCPAQGCSHTLQSDELSQLVDLPALRALRAARTAQHAARLRGIAAGAEGPELQALLQSGGACGCPSCRVLIQKAGGCRHMVCSVCGCDFEWQ
jgi:hypothetical protein